MTLLAIVVRCEPARKEEGRRVVPSAGCSAAAARRPSSYKISHRFSGFRYHAATLGNLAGNFAGETGCFPLIRAGYQPTIRRQVCRQNPVDTSVTTPVLIPANGGQANAEEIGFRFGAKGTHSSRTMMLDELRLV